MAMQRNKLGDTIAKTALAITIGLAVLSISVWFVWVKVLALSHPIVTAWAILATGLLPPAFFIGFWFGKVEARGFLGGIDKGLDKIARAVDIRENAKKPAAQQPPIVTSLPPEYPQISHRAPARDEIIDL